MRLNNQPALNIGAFATSAQGTKADTALQNAAAFATAAQGVKADYAGRYKVTVSLNINAVADNPITIPLAKWKLVRCDFHDPSTSLAISAAVVGLYTAAAAGGSNLITNVVTGLVTATDCITQVIGFLLVYQTAATIYLRPTITHGSAATISVTLHFDDLS